MLGIKLNLKDDPCTISVIEDDRTCYVATPYVLILKLHLNQPFIKIMNRHQISFNPANIFKDCSGFHPPSPPHIFRHYFEGADF